MIQRNLTHSIARSLMYFPVVGIIGSRQVGKTTLAKELIHQLPRASIYLDLELDSDIARLENAQHYLQMHLRQAKLFVLKLNMLRNLL